MASARKQQSRSGGSVTGRGAKDLATLERRRLRAGRLFEQGVAQAEVMRRVGATRSSVSRWYRRWETGGLDALRTERPAGRPTRMTAAQRVRLERELLKGARAHGYETDLWTLDRVGAVIKKLTGIIYHRGHVWKILKAMGWSRQRPARRAVERDDAAVERWVKDRWPKVKKNARRRKAWIVFEDESGVSLLPAVRATWAPRGRTPVLCHRFRWSRLSMAAALAYRSDRSETMLIFQIIERAYTTETLITFLTDLHRLLDGDKVTLVWDGLPSHRSKAMRAWLTKQRCWLVVEQLPAYAYELNPVEPMWGNLKGTELANRCPDTIDDAADAAHTGLCRIGTNQQLCFAFLDHTGLSL